MDVSAILAFILIFVLILAILVGIAYYGVNQSNRYAANGPASSSSTADSASGDAKQLKRQQQRQKSAVASNGKVHSNTLFFTN